jgi:hypothetical protein
MKIRFILFLLLYGCLHDGHLLAQSGTGLDPAQNFNLLQIQRNENKYYRIGNFKVTGTPFLFGEDQTGNVYTIRGSMKRVNLRYNIYSQEVETTTENSAVKILSIYIADIDSFVLIANADHNSDLKFINKKFFQSEDKGFLQEVMLGNQYSLYKVYKATLEILTTNYAESELREFAVNYNFYYTKPGSKEIILLRNSESFLKKEFAFKQDISPFLSDNRTLPEEKKLVLLFQSINK